MHSFEKSYIEQITHSGFPIIKFIESEKKYKYHLGGGELPVAEGGITGTSRFDDLVIPIGFDSHTNYFTPTLAPNAQKGGSLPISDDLFDKLFLQVTQPPRTSSHKTTLKKRTATKT